MNKATIVNQSSIQFNNYYIFLHNPVSIYFFFVNLFDEWLPRTLFFLIFSFKCIYHWICRSSTMEFISVAQTTIHNKIIFDCISRAEPAIDCMLCVCVCLRARFGVRSLYFISLYVTNIFAGQWIDDQWTIFAHGIQNNHIFVVVLLLSRASFL